LIINSGRFLQRAEVWFDELPSAPADIVVFKQAPIPVPGASCSDFYTLVIDLEAEEEAIFSGFKKGTKYEIKRAETKDAIACKSHSFDESKKVIGKFSDYYDQFAITKKLKLMDRAYLHKLANAGLLDISHSASPEGANLTWHVYYRSDRRVRLLYSASLFRLDADSASRSLIGRANRFHHWADIIRFRAENIKIYDFGGWYEGCSDPEKEKINNFKAEFGGVVVQNFNCVNVVSLKAKTLIWCKSMIEGLAKGFFAHSAMSASQGKVK